MRPLRIIVVLILSSLLTEFAAGAIKSTTQRGAQELVVFSLTKYPDGPSVQMEPIVVIKGSQYKPPPVEAEPGVSKQFTDAYFRTGRQYRVVFGGGDAGSLTVKKEIEPGCVFLMAEVDVQTTARLGGQVQALAISSDNIGRGPGSRRAPTEDERASTLDVARSLYQQRRVPSALIKKMQTVNLTAIDIERDGKFELIGNFEIQEQNGVEYNLFIILEPTPVGKYKAALNWYHKGTEDTLEDRSLVDILDLDGDGIAEVIAAGHYYESNDYIIFKRQAGTWRQIYKGGGGGC